MKNSLELALELNDFGLATIPIVAGKKEPAVKWKRFQHTGPSAAQLPLLFDQDRPLTVGVVCGEPSDRLMVLDCDNERILDQMMQRLDDPKTWVVKTSRGGHIYLRTPVPVRGTRGAGFDVKAQGGFVLAPGAVHPTGILYEFLRRTKNILELPSLDEIPGLVLDPAPITPAGIKPWVWAIIRGQDLGRKQTPDSKYASRNEADSAAINRLILDGMNFQDILGLWDRSAGPQTKFAERCKKSRQAGIDYLRDAFNAVSEWSATHESEGRQTAKRLHVWAVSAVWTGRAGGIDQAVYEAHCKVAERCGKTTYSASARTLAEIAGVNKETACHSNRRLTDRGLIKLDAKDPKRITANVWTLSEHPREECNSPYNYSPPNVKNCTDYCTLGHDLFRRAGMGKSAAQVWRALQSGPKTVKELVQATGRAERTIWLVLCGKDTSMERLGMVERDASARGTVWAACPGVDLDKIVGKLGPDVQGAGDRQKKRHAAERQIQKSGLDRGRQFA